MSDELARRAVAAKGWRWMPGMKEIDSRRHLCPDHEGRPGYTRDWYCDVYDYPNSESLPDLTDAATLGCLLALVGDDACIAQVRRNDIAPAWVVWRAGCEGRWERDTKAEALVAALETAP